MNKLNQTFTNYCNKIKSKTTKHRLLLIQMPQIDVEVLNKEIANVNGYYIFPPTGLQYVYEEIKHREIEVEIIDLNFEILKKFRNNKDFKPTNWIGILKSRIKKFNPTIYGVSCLFDFSIKYFLEILEYLKKESDSLILAGGVIATFEWKRILEKDLAHFVITGEAEASLNYLLDYITHQNFNSEASSNIYYKYEEQILETKGYKKNINFDTDLVDSYKLFNIEEYNKYGSLNPFSRTAQSILKFAVIQRSRGCRASCTFCSVEKIMGAGGRTRKNSSVLREMEYLINEKGITMPTIRATKITRGFLGETG